jgi:DNA-binding NtrC family response regulator
MGLIKPAGAKMKNAVENDPGQKVLIVDDDDDFRHELKRILIVNDVTTEVETANTGLAALEHLERGNIAVMLLDMIMPGISGTELLEIVTQRYPATPVIMITAVGDIKSIVNCIKLGAFDYLTKPLEAGRLFTTVTKALSFSELNNQNRQLRNYLLGGQLVRPEIFANIVTVNSNMKSIFKLVETVAATQHPVLIAGETGVGKELLARAVHEASGVSGSFVPVNLAGLDDAMFSDTLFGHKKGAYTGAGEVREGLIAKASGGTLFLDEIGDLSTESQKMLLRLLQEKEYYRLGSDILYKSNARIVAASNRDLNAMVAAGAFRQDLYHRLTIHKIQLPPLRARRDDISLLAQHFAKAAALGLGKNTATVSPGLRKALNGYDFPGNVRELMNMINNAVACSAAEMLTLEFFPELQPVSSGQEIGVIRASGDRLFTLQAFFETFPTLDEVERLFVQEAMKKSEGRKSIAAELLGISRPTLNKKLANEF